MAEIERLDFSEKTRYNSIEAAIHLNRYGLAKPYCKGARVLDAACGEGYGSYLMKSWGAQSVDAIDIDEVSIALAKSLFKSDGLSYVQGTVEQLPFEDNLFDLVVSLETMEHVDNVDMFLAEAKRVLKPGGTIILSCPNDNYYYEKDNIKNPFHKRPYTFFEFQSLAEKYFGTYVDYFLAFALDGFINLPFERRTEPERGNSEDALGLLHYTQCDQALCVPQERYLNQWNANYYVGIWGGMERANRYSITVSPREFFIDHTDKDYDLLHHIEDVQKEIAQLKNQIAVDAEESAQLRGKLEASQQEAERVRSELEGRREETARLRDQIETSNMEAMRIRVLLDLTKRERDAVSEQYRLAESRAESAVVRAESAEARAESAEARAQSAETRAESAETRVKSMESSRGVRLLGKLYNLRRKLKRL